MNELDEGSESGRFPTQQIFRASLIYGLISLAFLPVSIFFSSLSLIIPALICAAQFLDFRTRPENGTQYIKIFVGLIIYLIVVRFLPDIIIRLSLFDELTLTGIYFTIWLAPLVVGSLVLGATFPDALLRKVDGSRSVLFWVMIAVLILGILGGMCFGVLAHFVAESGI